MSQALKVLLAEDNPVDATLLIRQLKRAGFEPEMKWVSTEPEFLEGLRGELDIILSDYEMGGFNGLRALDLSVEHAPDVPFILISGTIGEDMAVEAIKRGASDYLLKDRMTRLGSAITHAIEEYRSRRERKKAEQALAESEARYRLLVEQAADGIFMVNGEGLFSDVNACGLEMTGYTREEFLRFGPRNLIAPEDHARLSEELAGLLGGGKRVSEWKLRRKDGSRFDAEVSARGLSDGQLLGIVRDLSVRRQAEQALRDSEERFRQIAENIQEVFWMFNPGDGQILYVSPAYEQVWGRTCESLYESTSGWMEGIHPDDRARVIAAVTKRRVNGDYHEVYRVVRPDKTVRWVRDRAFPIRDKQGGIYRIVGTAEDITEHRQLEEQLLRTQRLEAVGTLAGGVAHDLNNILAPTLMATELIRQKMTDLHGQQLLDMVEQSMRRGAGIIRQMLVFSRGVSGQRVSVQLRHLLKEVETLVKETFPRDVTLQMEMARDLRPVVADATQMHQVLINLCVNARDAMPGGGTLSLAARNVMLGPDDVKAHSQARPGMHVALTVGDTGCGIPASLHDRIFEPFFTTKEIGKGTGLGLSSVLGIVRSHGGFVTVDSAPGRGAVFTVHLPAQGEANAPAGAFMPAEGAMPRGQGELVMVVDDEMIIRETTKRLLEGNGYKVLLATQGREALVLFEGYRDRVKLVLTDVMMPVMGGAELIRELRALSPGIAVMVSSGLLENDQRRELATLGVTEVLAKPYGARDILEAVSRELRKK